MYKIINTNSILTIENGIQKYGPYASHAEMEDDINKNALDILYEPKDLLFDLEQADSEYYIYLATKTNTDSDSLGGHNVVGLPYGLGPEDCECTWAVECEDRAQVIKDMENCGFTYQNFLN